MLAIISLLIILLASILVTRVASVALVMTGLSREAARFQARSAFTGVGFTTTESESMMRHPARRRILMILMLLGNAGIVTALSSLLLSFVDGDEGLSNATKIATLAVGVALLWGVAHSKLIDRVLSRVFHRLLEETQSLPARDYANLLHLSRGYGIVELNVQEGDWLAGRRLAELRLPDEGVTVLGIERAEEEAYVGSPDGDSLVEEGDTLLLYGRSDQLNALDERRAGPSGDREHREKAARADREHEEERERERASRKKESEEKEESPTTKGKR